MIEILLFTEYRWFYRNARPPRIVPPCPWSGRFRPSSPRRKPRRSGRLGYPSGPVRTFLLRSYASIGDFMLLMPFAGTK